jgi:hypothetical protein
MNLKRQTTNINIMQKDASRLVREVETNPKVYFEVLRYSKPMAYIISAELGQDFVDFMEEKMFLSDKALVKSLIDSRMEIANGGGSELNDVISDIEK